MDRMTIKNGDGSYSQPTAFNWSDAFYKLAAYEDSGLTPKEAAELAKLKAEKEPDINLLRLIKIMEADADDRLVILPFKIGQKVYVRTRIVNRGYPYPFDIEKIFEESFTLEHMNHLRYVYGTREEAEQACAKEEDDGSTDI